MAKRKQKEGTGQQQSLSSFGFQGGFAAKKRKDGQGTSTESQSEGEKGKKSSASSKTKTSVSEPAKLNFQEKWTLEFPWMFRTSNGLMLCRTCQRANNRNTAFGGEGSKNFQRSALTRHQESLEHLASANFKPQTQRPIHGFEKPAPSGETTECMIDTVDWMVEEEVADRKFVPILSHMVRTLH